MIARIARLTTTISVLALSAPAFAEQVHETGPPPAAAGAESATSAPAVADDSIIVVTARRRTEDLQDIPLAVSAIGGEQLEATGSVNVSRLTQIQPSLQFYSTNPRNSAANLRGIGAPFGLTNDGIEQGVGIYIDQVYNSRIAATTFDFLDVERIEVLRGPQGTLYGKNTTAGAINIATRAPSFDFEGRAQLSIGNLEHVNGGISLSGPIVADRVAARIAASRSHRRGTIYNVATDRWVNEQDNLSLRTSVLWRPNDTLDVTLSGDYNRQDPECCAQIYVRTGSTQRPLTRQFAGLAAAFGYAPPSNNAFDRLTDLDTQLDAFQELGGTSLRIEWDLGPGTLTSISAWRFWNWGPSNDRDFTGLPITTVSANPSDQDQYSQELRYAVSGDRIDYVVGLFVYKQRQHTTGAQEQGPAASRWLLNPGNVPVGSSECNPPTANACNPAVLDGLRSENDIRLETTSLAAFGQASWEIVDRLTLQAGLRVNYDKKSGSYVATVFDGDGNLLVCNPPPTSSVVRDQCASLAPQSYDPRFSEWNISGDLTASYELAEDVLAYATYARAFKSGGINLSGLPLDANNQPILAVATVDPETVNHFELGLKTQLFDRRVTLNLAGFWTEIEDYQATVSNGQLGVLRGYLANADKVRSRGVELEIAARPTDGLSLYLNGAYTHARYVRFTDAPCPPELSGGSSGPVPSAPGTPGGVSPANCDISGQWLPGVSTWATSFGGEYALPQGTFGLDGEFYLGFDGSYRSRFSSNPSRSAYTDIEGYGLVNFRLGFRAADDWDVMAWVRNAFDQEYFDVLATQSGSTGLVVGQPGDPQTYGITFRVRI